MDVYIVTGAASGLGLAIYNLLRQNENCLLVDKNEAKLREIVSEGSNQSYFACDLTDMSSINRLFKYCLNKGIGIKGIIHCAGLSVISDFDKMQSEEYVRTFSINTFAFSELCKEISLYTHVCDDCRIIAISSIAAHRASSRQVVYASSKAALDSIVISAAQALVGKGIKVNAISLGACDTPMLSGMGISEQFRESLNRHYPLGVMEPTEIASIIKTLLSDQFKHMTGSIIKIDSGFSVVH